MILRRSLCLLATSETKNRQEECQSTCTLCNGELNQTIEKTFRCSSQNIDGWFDHPRDYEYSSQYRFRWSNVDKLVSSNIARILSPAKVFVMVGTGEGHGPWIRDAWLASSSDRSCLFWGAAL